MADRMTDLLGVLARFDALDFGAGWADVGLYLGDSDVADIDWVGLEERWSTTAVDATPPPTSQADGDRWVPVTEALEARARNWHGHVPPPSQLVDADAWYLPFHYFGHSWGVYVRESAVLDLAAVVAARVDPRWDPLAITKSSVRVATCALYLHEMFHHRVESFATRVEITERRSRYCEYTEDVDHPLSLKHESLEESLANAEMLRRLLEPAYTRTLPAGFLQEARPALHEWVLAMAPDYRRGVELRPDGPFTAASQLLWSRVHEAMATPERLGAEWSEARDMTRLLFEHRQVVRILVPAGEEPVIPWFDVGLRELSVSSKQLVAGLQTLGWQIEDGGKGSHIKMAKPGCPMVTVPHRKDIAKGTLGNIARSVGMTAHELHKAVTS